MTSVLTAWANTPKADVVYLTITHSLVGFLRDAWIILGASLFRKPVVAHHHGGAFHSFFGALPRWLRSLVRSTLERAHFVVVLGESLRHEFGMLSRGDEQVKVVHNACTVPALPPRPPPSGRLRILFLSNLMVEKGYLDVLESAALLHELLPRWDLEFRFAGQFILGGDRFAHTADMRQDFREHQLAAARTGVTITWEGVVSGPTKLALLREADAFVLPTYYRDEGQPISVIEALTSGLPVIATDYRGIPELLPPEMRRLLVPARAPRVIAERLASLALDSTLYSVLSSAAVRRAADFSREVHVRQLDLLFRAAKGAH
jgi:glycosyltransferase involved in cell wall biosynthesis